MTAFCHNTNSGITICLSTVASTVTLFVTNSPATIAITMDVDGPENILELENAYFDATHARVYHSCAFVSWNMCYFHFSLEIFELLLCIGQTIIGFMLGVLVSSVLSFLYR